MQIRVLIGLAVILLAALQPAEAAARKPKKWKPLPFSSNKEMPRPDTTSLAWKDQTGQVQVTADKPYFTGCLMWRGRADRDYKPFHQWEIRLRSDTTVRNLQFRLSSLGPDMKPILGRDGHWVKLGSLFGKKSVDFSYKLNTSAPSAIRVAMKWDGGEETYIAGDLTGLPQPAADLSGQPILIVMQPFFEYQKRKKQGIVQFYLRNDGDAAATEVRHIIMLKDSKGKVVKEHEYIPEEGTIKPGYAKEQIVNIKKCPYFSNIAIKTKKKEDNQAAIDGGAFTDAKEVQVAKFSFKKGQLQVSVKNGTKDAVSGMTLQIQLMDSAGNMIKEVPLAVGALAPGAIKDLQQQVDGVEAIGGWSFAYGFGEEAPETPKAGGGSANPPLEVDGISVQLLASEKAKAGLKVTVRIATARKEAISGLICELDLSDSSGKQSKVEVKVGNLPIGGSFETTVTAKGLKDIAGMGMAWRTGK